MLLPVSVSVYPPDFARPDVPAKTEATVAFAPELLMVGVAPARVIVPLEIVVVWLNVRLFAQTVPLTEAVALAVLKTAALVPPLVTSQGVPVTFADQLLADVSHEAPEVPVQVAVAAWRSEGKHTDAIAAASGATRLGLVLGKVEEEARFGFTGCTRREERVFMAGWLGFWRLGGRIPARICPENSEIHGHVK